MNVILFVGNMAIFRNSITLKHSKPFQILGKSISKYNVTQSEAEGLGDTGNEFPFEPDSLQVHDGGSHVRDNEPFIPWVKTQF